MAKQRFAGPDDLVDFPVVAPKTLADLPYFSVSSDGRKCECHICNRSMPVKDIYQHLRCRHGLKEGKKIVRGMGMPIPGSVEKCRCRICGTSVKKTNLETHLVRRHDGWEYSEDTLKRGCKGKGRGTRGKNATNRQTRY